MKRIVFITGGVVVFLAALVVGANYLPETCREQIGEVANLFSILASAVALVISFVLLDKYGLDKRIKDRREEVVLELMDALTDASLILEISSSGGGGSSEGYNLFSSESRSTSLGSPHYLYHNSEKRKLIFNRTYGEDLLKVSKYMNNFWLPKDIKDKLSKACEYVITYNDKLDPYDPKYIRMRFSTGVDFTGDRSHTYGVAGINNDLTEYVARWIELKKEILKWLKDNTHFSEELLSDGSN